MNDLQPRIIYTHQSVRDALEKLNRVPDGKTLFVLDAEQRLVGTLTDGDVRRSLLAGRQVQASVAEVMNREFHALRRHQFQLEEFDQIRRKRIFSVPFLDEEGRISRIIDAHELRSLLPCEAIIMAGGRGSRLRPLTDHTPKPLLPVGTKPILAHNIDRLVQYGIDRIHISVNYLGQQIKDYFGHEHPSGTKISYIHEPEPLGTFGSVKLGGAYESEHLLVMNSDLLTNIDFEDFYRAFLQTESDLAVASVPYRINVPYAIMETQGNQLTALKEKPVYTYHANAGIYLLKRQVLDLVPTHIPYQATSLIETLIQQKRPVIHYPILNYWLDIGKPEDYQKAQQDISHIKL
ncbi:Nucleotidyl transferase [Catalinimonas alkaloidigena]|uniref:Nucleotidyl transferase n=1 Tax=Catalinimonas alkaloidigena TaxID=1075417 RepID=A0A1G8ZJL5_9BACT|nr:nucleotidyltransferase family protein [Catalinimonas alkaloidigena]SDK15309.1 Nucleotidyl transferase [Catalinimonas alkaloidigena]